MTHIKTPLKWSLSTIFFLALLLPTASVVVTASVGIARHEKAMTRVMASYVENLAESVASRVNAQDLRWGFPIPVIGLLRQLQVFEWGPSLPGWIAVVDWDGNILLASPGAEETLQKLRVDCIPVGSATELSDLSGNRYTVAVEPAATTFVVAAVARNQLIGPMVQTTRLWALLMASIAVASVSSGILLWRWVIRPIKDLSDDMKKLKWGQEIPDKSGKDSVVEVKKLRSFLCSLSEAAVERLELWNRYLHDVVRVQEGEKSRIARDLHDGPVQEVTALIQRLRLASLDSPDEKEKHLKLAEEIGRETVRELREICTQLSPPWLDLGLKHALDELGDRLSKHLGMSIQVDVDEGVGDSQDRTLALFRIVQEAVHNAVRHGEAKHVKIVVRPRERGMVMTVEDDGKGFEFHGDVEAYRPYGHRGLLNMKERINLIGGDMDIKTGPGQGCLLTFDVPGDEPAS